MRITGLERAYESILRELELAHDAVKQTLSNEHPELEHIDTYVYSVPGKMLRPALVFLSGYGSVPGTDRRDSLITLATVFELLHGASLVHDDILDEDAIRRHLPTLHATLGPHIAVLAGDVLFTQAFALLSRNFTQDVVEPVISVARDMCHGEILAAARGEDTDRRLYDEIITLKTARMMSTACRTGAFVAGAPPEMVELFAAIGLAFGRAYQFLDDLVDDDHPFDTATIESTFLREIAGVRALLSEAPVNEWTDGLRAMVAYLERYARQVTDSKNNTSNEQASAIHYADRPSE